jgi:hypothetical protein
VAASATAATAAATMAGLPDEAALLPDELE